MGFFGAYRFEADQWSEYDPGSAPSIGSVAPWISVEIHDSDFTIVRYEPQGAGIGTAYLGYTPRSYFEDPNASNPTDTKAEAEGLSAWATSQGTRVGSDAVEAFLASDDVDDIDLDEEIDDELDDDDVFVEKKTAHFLTALGLPLPSDLEQP